MVKKRIIFPLLQRFRPEADVALHDRTMRVNLRDCVIGRGIYLQRSYEPEVGNLIRSFPLKGSTCVDVGANIGLHSVTLSRCVGKEGSVHAFEPENYNYGLLKKNLQLNGCENVTAHPCAVGSSCGSLQLNVNPQNFGDHSLAASSYSSHSAQPTEVTTLDNALVAVADGAVRLIKIDVQGFECQVIKGAAETLKRNPDVTILIEVEPQSLSRAGYSATELLTLLRDCGFTGWEFNSFRAAPLSEPWVYELIKGQGYVNAALSRNPDELEQIMRRLYP